MAASCIIFFINLNLTTRAITIFNDAVEDIEPDVSITFEEVNQLPVKNVDNKCRSIPIATCHIVVSLTILLSVNSKLFIPDNCLIDSVDVDGNPVCLQCYEYYDINATTNLCSIGECGYDSNVLRKDYSNFPIGKVEDSNHTLVNTTDT